MRAEIEIRKPGYWAWMAPALMLVQALALGLGAATPAAAQEDPVADMMSCEPLKLPRERLACFDAVLKKYKAQTGTLRPDDVRRNDGTPYYQRDYAESPAGRQRYESRPPRPSRSASRPEEPSRPAPSARRSASAAPDQLPERFRARVVRKWVGAVNQERRIKFALDNGTVWVQTDGPWVDLPEGNPEVEIYEGFMGGRRMKVGDEPGVSWVRRLKDEESAGNQAFSSAPDRAERTANERTGNDRRASQGRQAGRAQSGREGRQTASAAPGELPDRFQARVVRSWVGAVDNERRIKFELDNGTVWAQTDGPWVELPEGSPAVEIYEGFFGGHRMKVADKAGVSWVRRIE